VSFFLFLSGGLSALYHIISAIIFQFPVRSQIAFLWLFCLFAPFAPHFNEKIVNILLFSPVLPVDIEKLLCYTL